MMKFTGALLFFSVFCCLFDFSTAFWICPPKAEVPSIENVRFGRRRPQEKKCIEIPMIDKAFPFFVFPERADVKLVETDLIHFFELEMFPGYYIALVDESALTEFDLMTIDCSKQIISPPDPRPRKAHFPPSFKRIAVKDDIINSLDGDTFYTEMEKITGEAAFQVGGRPYTISTRYTGTTDNNNAAAYFLQRFQQLGYAASYQSFRYNAQSVQNIIAIKRGTSSNIVVVGAHYDSISQSPQTSAPGCVDNGSGAEGIMQLAAAFANYSSTLTIHFVLFGVEEQGLFGSQYYVDNLDNNGYNVVYSIIMDMIGFSDQYHGVRLETRNTEENREFLDLTEENLNTYSGQLSVVRNFLPFGSDHVPFLNAGITCFLAIERDGTNYDHYHRTTDTIDHLSVEQSIDIIRGLAGTLYDLAY